MFTPSFYQHTFQLFFNNFINNIFIINLFNSSILVLLFSIFGIFASNSEVLNSSSTDAEVAINYAEPFNNNIFQRMDDGSLELLTEEVLSTQWRAQFDIPADVLITNFHLETQKVQGTEKTVLLLKGSTADELTKFGFIVSIDEDGTLINEKKCTCSCTSTLTCCGDNCDVMTGVDENGKVTCACNSCHGSCCESEKKCGKKNGLDPAAP